MVAAGRQFAPDVAGRNGVPRFAIDGDNTGATSSEARFMVAQWRSDRSTTDAHCSVPCRLRICRNVRRDNAAPVVIGRGGEVDRESRSPERRPKPPVRLSSRRPYRFVKTTPSCIVVAEHPATTPPPVHRSPIIAPVLTDAQAVSAHYARRAPSSARRSRKPARRRHGGHCRWRRRPAGGDHLGGFTSAGAANCR